jgi:hypothetical protein
MKDTLKVTFDKNVYEFIVDPNKSDSVSVEEIEAYKIIQYAIIKGKVLPFMSETILTYESLAKNIRKEILSNDKPIILSSKDSTITISSNPQIHPGNHPKDIFYLLGAIDLGFKILPNKRFGKLINPAVKNEWYYITNEDYLVVADRYTEIDKAIETMEAGYTVYVKLIGKDENPHLKSYELIKRFNGSIKKLSSAISEWSDGDSVALHIAYNNDFFCTYDKGSKAGKNSIFRDSNISVLQKKFNFKKINPITLSNLIIKNLL